MDAYTKALVIILSAVLAVNLILWIFVLVKALQILSIIKRITEKAEEVAERVDHIGRFFEKTAAPVAIGKLLANIFESVRGRRSKRKKEEENE